MKFHPCARCLERPVLGSSTNRRHTQACRLTVLARHREDQRREEHADAGCRCPETGQSKAKVFISYSRKDIAFADRLDAALKARGFEPLIDRTDIYAFEEWWKRVEVLITCADTVVFVISPDAVRPGTVALKEVEFAASMNKRFAPVVWRRVDEKLIPEPLAKLDFILLDDEAQFEQRVDQLAEALRTDIGWIRQHTEFGEHARRWAQAKERFGAAASLAGVGAGGAVDRVEASRSTCTHRRDAGIHQAEPTGGYAEAQRPHRKPGGRFGAGSRSGRSGVLATRRRCRAAQHRTAERGAGEDRA